MAPKSSRDLHSSGTHGPTGAMDEDCFSRLGLGSQDKSFVCSEEGHPQRGSLGKGQPGVQGEYVGAVRDHVLGVRACVSASTTNKHTVTNLQINELFFRKLLYFSAPDLQGGDVPTKLLHIPCSI